MALVRPGPAGRQAQIIGRLPDGTPVYIDRAWSDYLTSGIFDRVGGVDSANLGDVSAVANAATLAAANAQSSADAAANDATDAMTEALAAQQSVTDLEVALTTQYMLRYDQDADPPTFAYMGQAVPGSSEGSAVWRIQKLTFGADGDVSSTWADGNANFDNVWTNRASLTYT